MHLNFYRKKRIIKKIIIVFSFLLLPLAVSAYELNLRYPNLGINLHQTQALGITGLVTWLYYMVIAIATAAAFGVIVWGGFEYLTSAGDSGKMRTGIDRIQNAVIGLLIVIVSYLGLNTINPNILSLEDPVSPFIGMGDSIKIPAWPRITFSPGLSYPVTEYPGTFPTLEGGVPYFAQNDPNAYWYNQPYGHNTMQASACGPTAASMVLAYYGISPMDPWIAATFSVANGYRATSGTYSSFFPAIAGYYGLKHDYISINQALAEARKGNPVILLGDYPPVHRWEGRSGGHFVVLTRADDNMIYINDPQIDPRTGRKTRAVPISEFLKSANRGAYLIY